MQQDEYKLFKLSDDKIILSPDLIDIINFLAELTNEMELLVNLENRISSIQKGFDTLVKVCSIQSKLLKENEINYSIDEPIHELEPTFKKLHNYSEPTRSIMVALFTKIEVMFCLYIAYEFETDKTDQVIRIATRQNDKEILKFFNMYFLTKNNNYYKKNSEKFSKISAKKFRLLRNSLIHFFSTINSIILYQSSNINGAIKANSKFKAKDYNNKVFISPSDLFELIKASFNLLFEKWETDSKENPDIFTKKIAFVKSIVKEKSSVSIRDSEWEI